MQTIVEEVKANGGKIGKYRGNPRVEAVLNQLQRLRHVIVANNGKGVTLKQL